MNDSVNPFGLEYRGLPIDQCQTEPGSWKVKSKTFSDLQVAHYWHLKPSEFWSSSDEDKAYMKAFMLSSHQIEAVEAYHRNNER